DIRITYAPWPGLDPATDRTFFDLVELARSLRRVVGGARPLRPEDLVSPERGASSADLRVAEAQSRATTARSALQAALGDLNAAPKWLQQAARVRPALGRWRRLALCAAALGGDINRLDVAQLPHVDGDRWAALPFAGVPPDGARVSLVLHRAGNPKATDPW